MNDITYDIMHDIMYVGCQVDEGDGADESVSASSVDKEGDAGACALGI